QPAIPDVGSVPAKATVTGWLYQPPPSGARSGVADVTVGASVSILNCRWNCTVDVPSVALHDSASALDLKVFTSGQSESVAPWTASCAVTALRYQPLSPVVPDVIVYETTGPAAPAVRAATSASASVARSAAVRISGGSRRRRGPPRSRR